MEASTTLLSILAALGLAAACGFRVFVPLFVVSLASRADVLELSSGFAWLGSTPALVCFGTATVLEVLAYYVPVVDNLLDSVATPAAVVAGIVVAAAVMTDIDPWLKWTLATVAGGGLAAAVQLPTVALRGVSTGTTAGLGNALVSSGEVVAASLFSGFAIFLPVLLPLLALALVVFAWRRLRRDETATARG
jgi:Domain of unknown function (DUF4126)